MARVLKGSHSFTCTPRVHPLTEWTIPAFTFPAKAGTRLRTPEGLKAELASGGWLVTYWNKCLAPGIEPGTVAHLSTNTARHRLTLLIEANALTTMPDHQLCCIWWCRWWCGSTRTFFLSMNTTPSHLSTSASSAFDLCPKCRCSPSKWTTVARLLAKIYFICFFCYSAYV